MTIDQARSRLKNLGLVIGKISAGTDDSKEDGVTFDAITSGESSKVTKGATVDVTVNRVKSKKVELPNLVGMTVKDAKDALASLGLNATISGAGDDTAVITQQSPEAGSSLDANTSVALTAEAQKSGTGC